MQVGPFLQEVRALILDQHGCTDQHAAVALEAGNDDGTQLSSQIREGDEVSITADLKTTWGSLGRADMSSLSSSEQTRARSSCPGSSEGQEVRLLRLARNVKDVAQCAIPLASNARLYV